MASVYRCTMSIQCGMELRCGDPAASCTPWCSV
jgi:hypothetical protein